MIPAVSTGSGFSASVRDPSVAMVKVAFTIGTHKGTPFSSATNNVSSTNGVRLWIFGWPMPLPRRLSQFCLDAEKRILDRRVRQLEPRNWRTQRHIVSNGHFDGAGNRNEREPLDGDECARPVDECLDIRLEQPRFSLLHLLMALLHQLDECSVEEGLVAVHDTPQHTRSGGVDCG